ncbi:MAG: response regulator [bacterium]
MDKAKILIVEDEIIIAKSLQMKLEGEGYLVCGVVSSGERAIQKAEEKRPDLVLMDIVLGGGMDGVEAADQIRSRFNIPVIYLTAYADRDILNRARITEPFGYVLKPFEDRELYANIEMALYKARMEARVREDEERLRRTFDESPIGAAILSLDYRFQQVNVRLCQMTGYSEKELLSRSFFEITHPDDQQIWLEEMWVLLTGRIDRFQLDIRLRHRDDRIIWICLSVSLIKDALGQPLYFLPMMEDITARKQAEDTLRTERQRLFALLDALPAFVLLQAPDSSIRFVNRYFIERFGEPKGRTIPEILVREGRVSGENYPSSHVFETGVPYQWEMIGTDGRMYEVHDYPFTDIDGSPLVLILGIDRTERRKMEEERQKAQRLESIGVLAGGIAHDFRNILVGIVGNLSLLRLYLEPDENISNLLDQAENASRRATDLSQQLLTFARGGAPVKEISSVSELLKDSAGFVLKGSKVKCELSLADDLWLVEIDTGQISQVFNNLLINANQAMPQGGIIRVSAENVTVSEQDGLPLREGRYIRVSVEDQGHGIPHEYLHRVFDPYFTTKEQGSGLGLATVYSIIRRHDGHIDVVSQLGVGTTFSLHLPAVEGKKTAARRNTVVRAVRPGEGRVLVLEDEDLVRNTVGKMLAYLGYEAEFALDGAQAVRLFQQARESGRPFVAVLADLIIPGGMGGHDAVKKLHELDPEVKAIATSGYANDPVLSEFRQYGFCAAIAKPYLIGELSDILGKVIGERNREHCGKKSELSDLN